MSVDLKKLKKLADTCRKAGILHFKSAEFEFTLSEAHQTPTRKKRGKVAGFSDPNEKVKSDGLSEEELLFWSTGVIENATKDQ